MTTQARITVLRYVLIITGAIFAFALYPLTQLWASGWSWGVGHSHYQMMIVGVYGTLGLCLIHGARDPVASRSLIWFTVWSSAVHAVIMAFQAVGDPAERGHLYGDIPALLLVAVALGVLTPRGSQLSVRSGTGVRQAA
jgi:hypothetical protein